MHNFASHHSLKKAFLRIERAIRKDALVTKRCNGYEVEGRSFKAIVEKNFNNERLANHYKLTLIESSGEIAHFMEYEHVYGERYFEQFFNNRKN